MRKFFKILIISLFFISIIIAFTFGFITKMRILEIFNLTFLNLLISFIIVLSWSQLNNLIKKSRHYGGKIILMGKEYNIWEGKLNLINKGIKDIREIEGLNKVYELIDLNLAGNQIKFISNLDNLKKLKILNLRNNLIGTIKGLENLKNLEELYLDGNKIQEIQGLNNLVNLKVLNLNSNQLNKIQGLENLINLERLYIGDNYLPQNLIEELGEINKDGEVKYPQKFVNYSSIKP